MKTFLHSESHSLTRYTPGSLGELWTVAFPLIVTAMSTSLMIFFDRLILAHYSIEAMNAAVAAGTVFTVFIFGGIATSAIAEVFVGQYNGAKQYHLLGKPVWQMIWFSLLTSIIFIPGGIWGGSLFLADDLQFQGLPYFRTLMFSGVLFPLVPALASFYIGQGKVRLILFCSILGNILNLIFDFAFIFGIKGWIRPMGTQGAAYATLIAQGTQVIILFLCFLSKHNRIYYGTSNYKFDLNLFLKSLKIGCPSALAHMTELAAWALLMYMMALISEAHLTVITVGQTVYIAMTFFTEGLQKAMTTLTANYIGSKQLQYIPQSIRSAFKLSCIVTAVMSIGLIFYPRILIGNFLEYQEILRSLCTKALYFVWGYVFFDSLTWSIAGVLIGASDTNFVMRTNAISILFGVLIPIGVFVFWLKGHPLLIWTFLLLYTILNTILFYVRYRKGLWKYTTILEYRS